MLSSPQPVVPHSTGFDRRDEGGGGRVQPGAATDDAADGCGRTWHTDGRSRSEEAWTYVRRRYDSRSRHPHTPGAASPARGKCFAMQSFHSSCQSAKRWKNAVVGNAGRARATDTLTVCHFSSGRRSTEADASGEIDAVRRERLQDSNPVDIDVPCICEQAASAHRPKIELRVFSITKRARNRSCRRVPACLPDFPDLMGEWRKKRGRTNLKQVSYLNGFPPPRLAWGRSGANAAASHGLSR